MRIIRASPPARPSRCAALVRRLVLFARDSDRTRPEVGDDAQQHEPAYDEDHEQRERVGGATVGEVAHGEERRPDHRAARAPAEERERDVVRAPDSLFGDTRRAPYRVPARPRRMNLSVEGY